APSGEPITKDRFYAALANGLDKVIALGDYDSASNLFTARIVKLHHDDGDRVRATATGEVLETDPAHMRFEITLSEWTGFDAQVGDGVKVATGIETQFFAPDGSQIRPMAFYSQAGPGTKVTVQGLYEDGVIRAAQVKVLSWSGGDTPDEATGIVRDVMPDQGAFTIGLLHWSGFDPPGDVLRIELTDTTVIVDDFGHEFTSDEFFHQIAAGGAVSAFGQFDTDHLTARKIVVHRWDGHVRFAGIALEWDVDLSTVVVGIGDGPAGTTLIDHIKVVGGADTQYFGPDGSAMTQADFFAALFVGRRLAVEGVFDGDVVHASTMRLL
ncbi:MAG TPA: hypothetical protein VNI20_09950, partial [Fimbriimonadaceae bacterium]|nr:hypothetical protein [Fimbriimonadaceae bacterium]